MLQGDRQRKATTQEEFHKHKVVRIHLTFSLQECLHNNFKWSNYKVLIRMRVVGVKFQNCFTRANIREKTDETSALFYLIIRPQGQTPLQVTSFNSNMLVSHHGMIPTSRPTLMKSLLKWRH
jgi:hypothetical protein